MTQKIASKILIRAEENATGGHFNLTVTTKSGRQYGSWDEDINLEDEDFMEIYEDDSFTYIPYSEIESIQA